MSKLRNVINRLPWRRHNPPELTLLSTTKITEKSVSRLTISPDGSKLATGYKETVKVWNVLSGALLCTLEGHSDRVTSVSFSFDSLKIVSACYSHDNVSVWGHDNMVKVWDVTRGVELRSLEEHDSHWSIESVAFSPDGTKVAAATRYRWKLWDVTSGALLHNLEVRPMVGTINKILFSPDGTMVASASSGRAGTTIKLWDVASGECIQTLMHSTHNLETVHGLSFSPDGMKLASGSLRYKGGTVKLWDVTSGKCLHTLKGHSQDVWSVSFSPDGTKVASASNIKVKLWDVASGKCLQTLKGKYIWGHSFSPNGMIVVLGPSKQNPEKVTINRYVFTSATSSFERNQDELRTRSALKF